MTAAAVTPVRRAQRIEIALARVLECVNAAAEQNQVKLPSRQYVTTGDPVYDCEEVVVSLQSLEIGAIDYDFDPTGCGVSNAPKKISVLVTIVRCLQVVTDAGVMIPAKKMTEKTYNYVQDGWVLMDMLACVHDHATGEVTFASPESGMVATFVQFEVPV